MRRDRDVAGALNKAAEEVVSATSPGEIQKKLTDAVTALWPGTEVRLYLYNPATRLLESVPGAGRRSVSVNPTSPGGGIATAVALAFRDRTLLNFPDTRRSSQFESWKTSELPRSVLFAPMLSRNRAAGVLELGHPYGLHRFSEHERSAAQHLANQMAVFVNLQGRRAWSLRPEESPAAVPPPSPCLDLAAGTVDINNLLSRVMTARQPEWNALGIDVRRHLSRAPLLTAGPGNELEQVFRKVLLHAGSSVADTPEKTIYVATRTLGRRALIEIAYSSPSHAGHPGSIPRDIWRTVVDDYGGEARFIEEPPRASRIEIDLPLSGDAREGPGLTAMLIGLEPEMQKRLMRDLSARNHRVIPARTLEEAVDMARRLPFDVAFCAEPRNRRDSGKAGTIRALVGAFLLMTDDDRPRGKDAGLVIHSAAYELELGRVLSEIEPTLLLS